MRYIEPTTKRRSSSRAASGVRAIAANSAAVRGATVGAVAGLNGTPGTVARTAATIGRSVSRSGGIDNAARARSKGCPKQQRAPLRFDEVQDGRPVGGGQRRA